MMVVPALCQTLGYNSLLFLRSCVCECVRVSVSVHMEIKGQLAGVSSLCAKCGSWGFEPRLLGLAAGAFTHRAISLALQQLP